MTNNPSAEVPSATAVALRSSDNDPFNIKAQGEINQSLGGRHQTQTAATNAYVDLMQNAVSQCYLQGSMSSQMQNGIPTQSPNHYTQQSQNFQQQNILSGTEFNYQSLSSIQNGFLPNLLEMNLAGQSPAIAYSQSMPAKNSPDYFKINRMIAAGDFSTE